MDPKSNTTFPQEVKQIEKTFFSQDYARAKARNIVIGYIIMIMTISPSHTFIIICSYGVTHSYSYGLHNHNLPISHFHNPMLTWGYTIIPLRLHNQHLTITCFYNHILTWGYILIQLRLHNHNLTVVCFHNHILTWHWCAHTVTVT